MNRQPHLFRVLGHVLGDYPLPAARGKRSAVCALARAARYVSEFVARDLDATRRMSPQPGWGRWSAPAPAPAAAGPPEARRTVVRPGGSQTSERARYGGPT